MARKSVKARNEGGDELESHDEELAEDTDEIPRKPISKAAAARDALASGVVVPKQASVYIKQKYGIEISPQQFSAEKCRLKRSTDSALSTDDDLSSSRSVTRSASLLGRTDLLEALEVMKPLIEQLGADKVKRMVDLLG